MSNQNNCNRPNPLDHVHGVEGFLVPVCIRREKHTHCFDTVSGRGIPCGNSHVHNVEFTTDVVDCHCHKFCGRTGPAIPSGFGEHIHLIESYTSCNDGHKHCTNVATSEALPPRC